ncbi:MAG TPA: Flp family type IVb pilin [Gemmatimonadaceae bacterium]|nr:Flp family type IVb pilin [Gemmatimonadaceae bacterium]
MQDMRYVKSFLSNEDGLAVTEYGLLLALVAVAVIAVVKAFGQQLQSIFTTSTSSLAAP